MRPPRFRPTVRSLMVAVAAVGLALGYIAWLGREDPLSGVDLAVRLAVGVIPLALLLTLAIPLRPGPPPPE
jgi:hypothetical protein